MFSTIFTSSPWLLKKQVSIFFILIFHEGYYNGFTHGVSLGVAHGPNDAKYTFSDVYKCIEVIKSAIKH